MAPPNLDRFGWMLTSHDRVFSLVPWNAGSHPDGNPVSFVDESRDEDQSIGRRPDDAWRGICAVGLVPGDDQPGRDHLWSSVTANQPHISGSIQR